MPDLLSTVPEDLREDTLQLITTPAECQKALGVHWDTEHDTLHVSTPAVASIASPTKRQIVSNVAKTFDLLGWFPPAVVVLKILLQNLGRLGKTWDEPVPDDIAAVWNN